MGVLKRLFERLVDLCEELIHCMTQSSFQIGKMRKILECRIFLDTSYEGRFTLKSKNVNIAYILQNKCNSLEAKVSQEQNFIYISVLGY